MGEEAVVTLAWVVAMLAWVAGTPVAEEAARHSNSMRVDSSPPVVGALAEEGSTCAQTIDLCLMLSTGNLKSTAGDIVHVGGATWRAMRPQNVLPLGVETWGRDEVVPCTLRGIDAFFLPQRVFAV